MDPEEKKIDPAQEKFERDLSEYKNSRIAGLINEERRAFREKEDVKKKAFDKYDEKVAWIIQKKKEIEELDHIPHSEGECIGEMFNVQVRR
jgi:hypothetical protein